VEETFATKSDLTNVVEHLKEWLVQILDQRFGSVDERFNSVDQKFDSVDERFNSVDQKIDAVDERFDEMALMVKQGFDAMDERFDRVETRLDNLEDQNDIRGQQNRLLAKRITVLELKQPA
jgi:exonuclease VII large subunit